jgi:hypothetical protein
MVSVEADVYRCVVTTVFEAWQLVVCEERATRHMSAIATIHVAASRHVILKAGACRRLASPPPTEASGLLARDFVCRDVCTRT